RQGTIEVHEPSQLARRRGHKAHSHPLARHESPKVSWYRCLIIRDKGMPITHEEIGMSSTKVRCDWRKTAADGSNAVGLPLRRKGCCFQRLAKTPRLS